MNAVCHTCQGWVCFCVSGVRRRGVSCFWQWRARASGAVALHIYDNPHIMCLALHSQACPAFLYGHSGTGAALPQNIEHERRRGMHAVAASPPWYVFFLCCSTPSCYVRGCSAAHLHAVHREDTYMYRQTEREAESVCTKYCHHSYPLEAERAAAAWCGVCGQCPVHSPNTDGWWMGVFVCGCCLLMSIPTTTITTDGVCRHCLLPVQGTDK